MKRQNKKISFFYLLVFIVLIVIFLFLIYNVIKWVYETNKSKNILADVKNLVIENPVNQEEKSQSLEIDFNKLYDMNSDIAGWITIQNTDINYPIVKSTDNDYYLHYNFLKQTSQNGWIFMDYRNNENFTDNNTIIFGHNIKSGIMFSDLKKIYNGSVDKGSIITIYTKSGSINKYQIYSCYMISPDELSINPYITDKQLPDFKKQMESRSKYDYNVNLTTNETITLSTCDSTGKKRILIHAILEK